MRVQRFRYQCVRVQNEHSINCDQMGQWEDGPRDVELEQFRIEHLDDIGETRHAMGVDTGRCQLFLKPSRCIRRKPSPDAKRKPILRQAPILVDTIEGTCSYGGGKAVDDADGSR